MRVDPAAEAYIDPRNVRRVIRALEVQTATGKPLSYWRTREPPPFSTFVIGCAVPREQLYDRIDRRVDAMYELGLIDEVKFLLERGYDRSLPSMSGIGYGEVCEYLAGESSLDSAIERTKTRTHRLVRHQNSWFKPGDKRIRWLESAEAFLSVERWLETPLSL
jgi:tRNA dimethylallyltransferase